MGGIQQNLPLQLSRLLCLNQGCTCQPKAFWNPQRGVRICSIVTSRLFLFVYGMLGFCLRTMPSQASSDVRCVGFAFLLVKR